MFKEPTKRELEKKYRAKHGIAMSPVVYWHIADGLIDVWRLYVSRSIMCQNAHKILPHINVEYEGNICKLEEERDYFLAKVKQYLVGYVWICDIFGTEPVLVNWLEEYLPDVSSCKKFSLALKKKMYSGCTPTPLSKLL